MRTWRGTRRAPAAATGDAGVKSALVTGAGGFVGQWLCRDLVRHGWAVTASSLTGDPGAQVLGDEDHAGVTWRHEDLRDPHAIRDALDASRPDAIFHLAGVSLVPAAGDDPSLAFEVNTGLAVRLLSEVRVRKIAGTLDPSIVIVGSAEQYGRHDAAAMPLGENAECRPRTFYAATKMAQEAFSLEAFRSDGVRVVCTRSFNHSGRGQAKSFLLPALVERVVRARGAATATVAIGNTITVRDFLHVEDVARAYTLLAEKGLAGNVYNVCSGRGVSVGDLAAEVLQAAGVNAKLVPDDSLRRAVDVPCLVGRNDNLREDTGWSPVRSRADIITDLLGAA